MRQQSCGNAHYQLKSFYELEYDRSPMGRKSFKGTHSARRAPARLPFYRTKGSGKTHPSVALRANVELSNPA